MQNHLYKNLKVKIYKTIILPIVLLELNMWFAAPKGATAMN
jgi:hypothetical protein